MKKIILASASPRRKELLEQVGIEFEVMTSKAEEVYTENRPGEIAKELSKIKARAVAGRIQGQAVILGADTIVCLDEKILGKPEKEEHALQMLKSLSGNTHQVYTGVTMILKEGEQEKEVSFYEKTDVVMYPITDQEIKKYIASKEPMDKAGAYGIQGKAAVFVKEISGDYNNVVGLPVARVYQELKKWIEDVE